MTKKPRPPPPGPPKQGAAISPPPLGPSHRDSVLVHACSHRLFSARCSVLHASPYPSALSASRSCLLGPISRRAEPLSGWAARPSSKKHGIFFPPSYCLQKKTSGEKGGKGSGTAFCNGGCSISLLIPFSVFLIFGILLHSEGIFLGILFIRERRAFLFLSLLHAGARLPRCLVF